MKFRIDSSLLLRYEQPFDAAAPQSNAALTQFGHSFNIYPLKWTDFPGEVD
jgi:hypothetical protein